MAREFAKRFYRSMLWRQTRECALRRDMFTCRDCGGRATEVHHIIELTPNNIDEPTIALGLNNLMSLCGPCHAARTAGTGDVGDVSEGYIFDADGQVVPVEHPPCFLTKS